MRGYCHNCGEHLPPKRTAKRGYKYCSLTCREAARISIAYMSNRLSYCAWCDNPYVQPIAQRRIHCGPACTKAASDQAKHDAALAAVSWCSCGTGLPNHRATYCASCAKQRIAQRRKTGPRWGTVTDDMICTSCGCTCTEPVGTNAPTDACAGHKVPVLLGGTDNLENIVLMCRSCVARQGASMDKRALAHHRRLVRIAAAAS